MAIADVEREKLTQLARHQDFGRNCRPSRKRDEILAGCHVGVETAFSTPDMSCP